MRYIDTSSFDDYDRVAKYLSEKGVSILKRNKLKMVIAADVSREFVSEMVRTVKFDELVSDGEKPLEPID